MTERRKQAYRHLQYRAMLEIRGLYSLRAPKIWQPHEVWRQYRLSQTAGALANWLHNLALYSARDFQGFREEWFWESYEGFRQRFPESWTDYKQEFEDELKRQKERRNG